MTHLDAYTIKEFSSCREALEAIDKNKKGFLIVLDKDNRVVGTITDGDLRRAVLQGMQLEDKIGETNVFCRNCFTVHQDTSVEEMVEIFKDQHLEFLPILDEDNNLAGIITKRQLHAILLQGMDLPETSKIIDIDESVNDFEIFAKPWGIYKTTLLTDCYQQKLLRINPGAKLSLQYHDKREEYWIIVSGIGEVQLDESIIPVSQGSTIFIPRGSNHRLSNTSATEPLIVGETQIGNYFGEDDIVRIEDMYGRA